MPGKRRRFRELGDSTTFLLDQASSVLSEQVIGSVVAAGHPIRAAHATVLTHVDPKGIRLSKLAGRAKMSPQAMSELVDDLTKLGYLQRVPDTTDRRAKLIVLTEVGASAAKATFDAIAGIEQALEALLEQENLAELRAMLRLILGASDRG